MKKFIFILIITLTIFTSCSNKQDNVTDVSQKTLNDAEYDSISVSAEFWSENKKDIERFIEIVKNAQSVTQKPTNPQSSLLFKFTLNGKDGVPDRVFSMNGSALFEEINDDEVKYYILDKNSKDYEFIQKFCLSYLK